MKHLLVKTPHDELRTPEELRQHYEIEKELAGRLWNSKKEDRAKLYAAVYDELFQRVPAHPQLTRTAHPDTMREILGLKMTLLQQFLKHDTVFLELGAGDCRLALEVAKTARKVYAVDVSVEVTKEVTAPPNFELLLSNGTDIPIAPGTVDVAYSYQLMEHIHPDDAMEQLRNIYAVLRPGGLYICITPNRVAGPHDISKYFDKTASGFHLREYTIAELGGLFESVGFTHVWAHVGIRGHFVKMPCPAIRCLESVIGGLPWRTRHLLANSPGIRNILLAAVVAKKQ